MTQPEELRSGRPLSGPREPASRSGHCSVPASREIWRRYSISLPRTRPLVRCHYSYRKPLYFAVREDRLNVAAWLLERDPDPFWPGGARQPVGDRPRPGLRGHGAPANGVLRKPLDVSPRGRTCCRRHPGTEPGKIAFQAGRRTGPGPCRGCAGNQPIHWAVMTRQVELVDELLRRGADPRRGVRMEPGPFTSPTATTTSAAGVMSPGTGPRRSRSSDIWWIEEQPWISAWFAPPATSRGCVSCWIRILLRQPCLRIPGITWARGLRSRMQPPAGHLRSSDASWNGARIRIYPRKASLLTARAAFRRGSRTHRNCPAAAGAQCASQCGDRKSPRHPSAAFGFGWLFHPAQFGNGGTPVFHGAARAVHLLAYSGDKRTAAGRSPRIRLWPTIPRRWPTRRARAGRFVRLMLRYHPTCPDALHSRMGGFAPDAARSRSNCSAWDEPQCPDWLGITRCIISPRKGRGAGRLVFDLERTCTRATRIFAPRRWLGPQSRPPSDGGVPPSTRAKPNLPDDLPWATPAAWATRRGHPDVVTLLARHGAR